VPYLSALEISHYKALYKSTYTLLWVCCRTNPGNQKSKFGQNYTVLRFLVSLGSSIYLLLWAVILSVDRRSHSEHLFICKEDWSPRQTRKTFSEVAYSASCEQCSSPQSALRTSPLKAFQLQILSYDACLPWYFNQSISHLFHGLSCEFRAGPLDSEPYRSPSQYFHSCVHFAVCRCTDVCPLCPCLWTSSATC